MKRITIFVVVLTILLSACGGSGGGGGSEGGSTEPPAVTLDSIDVTPASATIPSGISQTFTATGNYSDGTSEDITASVTWSSTDTSLASVDAAGLVTATAPGTANIQASMDSVMGEAPVTISNAILNRITLDPTDPELAVGLSRRFAATGHFSDGSAVPLSSLTWSSSDESVATINTNGRVIAVSSGTTKITATDGSLTGQTVMRVPDIALADIVVTALNGATELPVGTTLRYTATGMFDDGSSEDISTDVTWYSSDETVATISTRLATGLSVGQTDISAGLGSITSSGVPLSVTSASLESIEVTPNSNGDRRVLKGNTKDFQALGNFSDGSVKDITIFAQTRWTSNDTSVATVKKGTVTGKGSGTATITVNNRGVKTSFDVTVVVLDSNNVASITISPDNAFIRYDHTQSYTVTANLLSGGTETVTRLVNWTVGDGDIVSIDTNGLATGLGIGNTTFTAEYEGVTAQVTVHGVGKSPVLQTGQTTCYDENGNLLGSCVGTGQDGELQSGLSLANRWTVSGDCITDNVTGLQWLRPDIVNSNDTWLNAISTVNQLTNCTHGDWRMPNWNEMRSLVNYGEDVPGAYLESQGFTGTGNTTVWTSTSDATGYENKYYLDLSDGEDYSGPVFGPFGGAFPQGVWAVRTISDASKLPRTGQTTCWDDFGGNVSCSSTTGVGQDGDVQAGVSWPELRFVRDGECMTDLLTGLTWARTPDNTIRDWQGALNFASSTSYCGQGGWRLPSINELQSLIHKGYPVGLLEVNDYLTTEGFGSVPGVVYWSSTSNESDPATAWAVQMAGSGTTFTLGKVGVAPAGDGRAWLVRGRRVFE